MREGEGKASRVEGCRSGKGESGCARRGGEGSRPQQAQGPPGDKAGQRPRAGLGGAVRPGGQAEAGCGLGHRDAVWMWITSGDPEHLLGGWGRAALSLGMGKEAGDRGLGRAAGTRKRTAETLLK